MCGICGVINLDGRNAQEGVLRSMMESIAHRGPDDEGVSLDGFTGFGFKRLSILDLTSAGHQPMQDASGRYTIIFNGEIYNYLELRDTLRARHYTFRSETDTEVLLKAFIEWDIDCLQRLNGMFAFAIYDNKTERTVIVRDRFGIKPLYYYQSDQRFLFSSEISSLLSQLEKKDIRANKQSIFNYLAFNRTDQTEHTFFENIKKLQHGSYIEITPENIKIKKWYELASNLSKPFKNAKEYRDIFSSAVGLRLRSDVPVGACLSGGLDSSSIVSTLLDDFGKTDLHTFSAVYGEGSKGDESPFINLYQDQLSNMHFTTPTGASLLEDMETFLTVHSEPMPSTSPYAQFKVMELAKEYVVVTLDGQGADEQLGGYHYFFGNYFKELLTSFRFAKLAGEGGRYLQSHRSFYGLQTFLFFLLPEKMQTLVRSKDKEYLNPGFTAEFADNNVIAGQLYNAGTLRQAFLNHFEYKLEHLLKWDDRNSMWFSLESRVPFLDHRLVERTLALSAGQIINKGSTKHILREAMKGTLPDKIQKRQDKIGFVTAEDEWFREEKFQQFIKQIIYSKTFAQRGFFDAQRVHQLYKKHVERRINISKEIWKWINIELWFRKYID